VACLSVCGLGLLGPFPVRSPAFLIAHEFNMPPVANAPSAPLAHELTDALRQCLRPLGGVAVFSALINLLALTGSLYMLQVYDRVIPSHNTATLIALTILMVGLYVAFGAFDLLRSRIMMRIGFRFDRLMRRPVFAATLVLPLRLRNTAAAAQPQRDLEQIRTFMAGQGPIALLDIPWLPVYLLLVFLLHPLLGLLAVLGSIILVALALLTEFRSRAPAEATSQSTAERQTFAEAARRNAEIIEALGLQERALERWEQQSMCVQRDQAGALAVTSGLGAVSRVFRMVLQSAMLGLGAYVVIRGEATGGVMIAASIMTSRALAPIEIAIANWRSFIAARQGYRRLGQVLANMPASRERLRLPRPCRDLEIEGLFVMSPSGDHTIIQNVAFTLKAGDGLAVIGPSASGKSTLAKALTGVWLTQRGTIRLDGATLDQFDGSVRGRDTGYLPQDIGLFAGTVAQNIARLDPKPPAEKVIAAAQTADVHEMILQLPKGYDTFVGESGAMLSAGQRQRIALARALYDDPFLVVLDEPNSNLDAVGEAALISAIASVRSRGGIVIVISHRPSALAAVDQVAVMSEGRMLTIGPKKEILAKALQPVPSPTVTRTNTPQPVRAAGGI
jgi:PrtD family type I secretion system ABC transporter